MDNQQKNKYDYILRMERKINLDKITNLSKSKIRKATGVRTTKKLIEKAEAQGLDLGKRQATREKRAFQYFGELYNEQVERNNETVLSTRKQTNKVKYFIKNKKKNYININFESKSALINSLEVLKNNNKKYLLIFDNNHYTLNKSNVVRLQSIIENGSVIGLKDYTKSDEDIAQYFLRYDKKITIEKINEIENNKLLIKGLFFKYTHNTELDLEKYQIFREFTAEKVDVNCFIQSMICANVEISIIEQMKRVIMTRDVPQRLIKNICEKFDLHITIRYINSNHNLRRYGNKEKPEIKLGLIDEHYFYIDEVPVSSYALKNYNTLKKYKNWYNIQGITKDGKLKRRNRYINSYDVIKILIENKDELLTPITDRSELEKTIHYNRGFEIGSLDYDGAKENKYLEKDDDNFQNVFFDCECSTDGEKHKAYLVRCDVINKQFLGEDCCKKMLYKLVDKYEGKNIRLIAHNAGYDLRFIMEHLIVDPVKGIIQRGKFLLRGHFRFYYAKGKYIKIQIQDSYSLIPEKLIKFTDMFKIKQEKEIMPYNLYTQENVKIRYIDVEICKNACEKQFEFNNIGKDVDIEKQKEFINTFIYNCNRWDCMSDDGKVDIIKYSDNYCDMDVQVLKEGYNKFKENIKTITGLNIDNYISLASIAHDYMKKEDVFEYVYELNGICREFIQKCLVGGRTMTAENKKYIVDKMVADFDAVSLYPSAMRELGGYLKGKPKVLTNKTYEFLQSVDGYFIEIKILKVNKHYKFPLMSYVNKDGVRTFSNDMVNKIVYVDKIFLEDLIQLQKIEFEIIRGYYYNEGRNNNLKPVISHIFEERVKQKKLGNPIQNSYKLLMNSSYGKTCQKPIETDTKFISVTKEKEYVSKYFDRILEYEILPNNRDVKIKMIKTINDHFNNIHCGVEILSMSKRIMNRVMCLAEDMGFTIYYQDTDSMHIHSDQVEPLAEKYKEIYGNELIGKGMGQFHTDFDSKICKGELNSIKSIFLGKKCYIDVLEGDNKGVYDYHIRMKGVSSDSIKHYAHKHNMNIYDVYKKLYDGEEITFDLCCDGKKISFDFKNNMTIKTLDLFERRIKF